MCRWTWDLQIIKLHNYIYIFFNITYLKTLSSIVLNLEFQITLPFAELQFHILEVDVSGNWHHIFFGYHFGFLFGYVPKGNGGGGAKRGWGFRLEGKILTLKILTLIPFSQRKGNAFIYHAEKTVFLLHGYSSHTVSLIYNLGLCNA